MPSHLERQQRSTTSSHIKSIKLQTRKKCFLTCNLPSQGFCIKRYMSANLYEIENISYFNQICKWDGRPNIFVCFLTILECRKIRILVNLLKWNFETNNIYLNWSSGNFAMLQSVQLLYLFTPYLVNNLGIIEKG